MSKLVVRQLDRRPGRGSTCRRAPGRSGRSSVERAQTRDAVRERVALVVGDAAGDAADVDGSAARIRAGLGQLCDRRPGVACVRDGEVAGDRVCQAMLSAPGQSLNACAPVPSWAKARARDQYRCRCDESQQREHESCFHNESFLEVGVLTETCAPASDAPRSPPGTCACDPACEFPRHPPIARWNIPPCSRLSIDSTLAGRSDSESLP